LASRLIPTLLFDLALIIALAQVLGALARRFGQPPVIGEILAGILVGPTLFHGAIARTVFPVDVRPSLGALANIGVAVFMFIVGLELDRSLLRDQGRVVATVSLGSMVLPFALGTLLALHLVQQHPSAHRLGFVLFIGAAMAVTAFPVLARILTDRGMLGTPLGGLALTVAAVDDVLAWSLLAVVVALTGGGPDQWRMLLAAPYLALMIWVMRPLLRRLATRYPDRELTLGMLAMVFAGLLLSAGLTEWMGLHFIFGAFLFGAAMPRTEVAALRQQILERVGQVCSVLLLPVFFVVGGLNVDLSTMDASAFGQLGLILLVAIGGKFAGAFLGARAHGVPVRQSAVLGALINTRGLTELIILAVGLQLGVLDRPLYSLMVVMAVLTAMTGPLLRLVYSEERIREDAHSSGR
jgi:Kef-type K+ transport system membrane component KefB